MPEFEGATPAPDVSGTPETSSTDSSSVSQGVGAPSEQSAGGVTTPTADQGSQPTADPFADLPSVEELTQQAGQGVKYAAALANLRGVLDPLRTQNTELTQKWQSYEPMLERFEQPEQLQEVLGFRDSIIAWENDPVTGEPVPAPNVQFLQEKYRSHADYLVADLLNLPTVDPETGREVPRADLILEAWRDSPERRAHVAKVLGLV